MCNSELLLLSDKVTSYYLYLCCERRNSHAFLSEQHLRFTQLLAGGRRYTLFFQCGVLHVHTININYMK